MRTRARQLVSGALLGALLLVLSIGCGAAEPRVRLTTDWPTSAPGDYEDVVETWTRTASLRGEYQEVLELAAVLKSPEWRLAHAARDASHRGLAGPAREERIAQARAEAAGPVEVQLLVTTWDRRENDLERGAKSVWRVVLLDDTGREIAPLEIIRDKRPPFVVRAEYPALGDFAQSYIARFPPDANILGPTVRQVRLRLSSQRGGVEVRWSAP